MTVGGKTEADLLSGPVLVTTAHFGLTLIRTECLNDVKKPWFFSKPDENGKWDDNRLDEDIWFWHQWRLAGKNIYVAPNAKIGHLELIVSGYDDSNHPEHIHVGEWRKKHRGR
jgi:hypothetical protein